MGIGTYRIRCTFTIEDDLFHVWGMGNGEWGMGLCTLYSLLM